MRVDTKTIKLWVNLLNDGIEKREALVYVYICGTHISDCAKLFKCNESIIIQTLQEENVFEFKICKKCELLLPFKLFNKQKNVKIGLSSKCKICRAEHDSEFYWNNRNRILRQTKQYMKQYTQREDVKIRKNEYMKEYSKTPSHVAKRIIYLKEYNSRPEVKERRNNYSKEQYRTNPKYRLRQCVTSNIYNKITGKNNRSSFDILDYTIEELMIHLEDQFRDGMTWDNYGSYWQIDHKIPVNSFNFTTTEEEDFKKCWSLKNLQPLTKKENRDKWDYISKKYDNVA